MRKAGEILKYKNKIIECKLWTVENNDLFKWIEIGR